GGGVSVAGGAVELGAGGSATITIDFNKAVTVSGTPTLTLSDGETATYTGGSGTAALTFAFTATAGHSTTDLQVTGLSLPSGATVVDNVGNALSGAVTGDLQLIVETSAPTITSIVATTNDGATLKAGDAATIFLNLSEDVTVNGAPTLTLSNGAVAAYSGGSGSGVLSFTYTVATGHDTADLQVVGLSDTGGASIQDAAANMLATSASANLHLVVDTTVAATGSTSAAGTAPTSTSSSSSASSGASAATGGVAASSDPAGGSTTATEQGTQLATNVTLLSGAGSAQGGEVALVHDGVDPTVGGVETMIFSNGALSFDLSSPQAELYRLYDTAFGRTPDPSGFAGWIQAYESGDSFSQIATAFLASAEAQARYPSAVDNAQFVTDIYENALHRAPDAAGLQGWVAELNTGSVTRADVLLSISESAEHQADTAAAVASGLWTSTSAASATAGPASASALLDIQFLTGALTFDPASPQAELYRLYDTAFGRTPDPSGFASWIQANANGESFSQIATAFLASAEAQARYPSTVDNAQFVTDIYENALHRAPDATGLQGWVNELSNGSTTRADVLLSISESPEHQADTADAIANGFWTPSPTADSLISLYDAAFGHSPDNSTLDSLLTGLSSGESLSAVSDQLASSAAFLSEFGLPSSTPLTTTDQAFVGQLYEVALRRPADAGGLSTFIHELQTGSSYGDVVLQIAQSQEHQNILSANGDFSLFGA
ncbi:MAG: DUF4214 domain-containing protein, partial [Caulobacteraceae bacterium]